MSTSIPPNPAPPANTAPSNSITGALAAGTSIWLKIANIQPISAELRPLANQTLVNALTASTNLNTLLGTSTANSAKSLLAANQTEQQPSTPNALANNQSNVEQLSRLLQAKQLFLLQALLRSQPVNLITDQELAAGSQLQIKTSAQGLLLVAKHDIQLSSQQSTTALPTHDNKQSPLSEADSHALNALLRKALPMQQSSASAVKSLDVLLTKILNDTAANHSTSAEKSLISSLQKLTQTLSLNSNAQTLKSAVINSGIFSEARLNQLQQTLNPHAATNNPLSQSLVDTKLQLWQLFAQLSTPSQTNTNPASTPVATSPAPKETGLAQQLLNLLGISIEHNAGTSSSKTNYKQALSEIGKQWLAKITAQQLANLIDEPDSKTLKTLTLELPIRTEQQVTPLQLNFSKFWHYEEDEKEDTSAATKEQKREIVWQVTLSINVENLGTIDARIRYLNQRLHCSLWAEQASTLELVEKQASQLAKAIQRKGLAVEPIHCHAGRMPSPTNRLSQPLLDTHA